MKEEDKKLFSAKLHQLADKFDSMAQAPVPGCCPPGNRCVTVDPQAAEEFNQMSQKIYEEFKSAGYNDDDWDGLMQSSEAGQRMTLTP